MPAVIEDSFWTHAWRWTAGQIDVVVEIVIQIWITKDNTKLQCSVVLTSESITKYVQPRNLLITLSVITIFDLVDQYEISLTVDFL